MAKKATATKKETAAKKTVETAAPEVVEQKETKTIDAEEILASLPKDENGEIIGTDRDGGVVGALGEQGNVVMPEFIKDALEKVDTEIKDEEPKSEAEKEVEETINEVEEIQEEVKEIESRQAEVQAALAKEPEKAEELVKEEIKKAEEVKAKIDKVIKKPRMNITSWWNGNGYDI